MKVALLDKRLGESRQDREDKFFVKPGIPWYNPNLLGNENTFAILEAFGNVMTGPSNSETDYTLLQDYDLIYVRAREPKELESLTKLRRTCPEPIIMVYTDEWVNYTEFDSSIWLSKLSKEVDAIICGFGEKYTREVYSKMKVDNFYHCPYGGDVFRWKQHFRSLEDREFAVAGMWHIRSFKEQGRGDILHTRTLITLKKLQDELGAKCYFFLNYDGVEHEDKILGFAQKMDLELETLKHMPNHDFNEKMASVRLFIEEYPCPSFSRATVVSAAVGTPSVSTDMNNPSTECFPDLTVPFGDWDTWNNLSMKLMTDDEFWLDQQKIGFENVDYYYYPALKERITNLYNHLLEARK